MTLISAALLVGQAMATDPGSCAYEAFEGAGRAARSVATGTGTPQRVCLRSNEGQVLRRTYTVARQSDPARWIHGQRPDDVGCSVLCLPDGTWLVGPNHEPAFQYWLTLDARSPRSEAVYVWLPGATTRSWPLRELSLLRP